MAAISLIFALFAPILFCVLMIWAAVNDVRTLKITNKLNLVIAVSFLVLALPTGLPWMELIEHVKIGAIVSVIALILFLIGVIGGGDFKMIGATALWMGPKAILPFTIYLVLAGGLLSIILLVGRAAAKRFGLPRSPRWARRLLRKRSGVPYGVAICIGALLSMPRAGWFPTGLFG